ncbi:MAG: fibronectin type III domain-containing protein [Prevotellaceae bacterium]|jgi:hypothetical protein|nr:fibronectin type III domain-containing protein [Prevotellaceae bacterium]
MKKKQLLNRCLLLGLLCIASVQLSAQLVYWHGFEATSGTPAEAAENANWQLVPDGAKVNRWVIGNAPGAARTKQYGLYVSNDGGATTNYSPESSVSMAYREFTLPAGSDYSIAFDWKARGNINDSLYVCWVTNPSTVIAAGAGSTLPSWVATDLKAQLGGSPSVFRSKAIKVTGNGQPAKLVFIWKNSNATAGTPGACIDNIEINSITRSDYTCGFDDAAENAKWTLKSHKNNANNWRIGSMPTAVTTPPNALYISPINRDSCTYDGTEGTVVAYREFVFAQDAVVDVSLDWKAYGEDNQDMFYICWLTEKDSTQQLNGTATSTTPGWVPLNAIPANVLSATPIEMEGTLRWQNASFKLTGTGRRCRLVFLWKNNINHTVPPGACIDNIQMSQSTCAQPGNVTATVTGSSEVVLKWTGTASGYEVKYRNQTTQSPWLSIPGITVDSCVVTGLNDRGLYTFWVRSLCGNDSSLWKVIHNTMVIADPGCIDFTDLKNTTIVRATYGTYSNPSQTVGVIDFGQNSDESQHTVVTEPEFDTRTGTPMLPRLKTIPDNELAVVRLGNSKVSGATGGYAETITYTYKVDSVYSVLLMNYAVVFQQDHLKPHGKQDQPMFTIEILNAVGFPIDPLCGRVDFTANYNTQDWHTYTNGSMDILWKDWTTIGLNLNDYRGQTIKVCLTTRDCSMGAHYGYAYYTLGCVKGDLEGLSCGLESGKAIVAPEGFDYEWYKKYDTQGRLIPYAQGNVVYTGRSFTPLASDTCTYTVRMNLIGMSGCFFELEASLKPRWPKASATYKIEPENCENVVKFTNKSEIVTSAGTPVASGCDEYIWEFPDGSTSTATDPTYTFPSAGGIHFIKLKAFTGNRLCEDDTTIMVILPPIGSTSQEENRYICVGDTVMVGDSIFNATGTYTIRDTLSSGCESITTLHLQVADRFDVTVDTVICDGGYLVVGDSIFLRDPGTHVVTLPSIAGCDSVVTVHLNINPVMTIDLGALSDICADDQTFTVPYLLQGGSSPTSYRLEFDAKAQAQGFTDADLPIGAVDNFTIPLPNNLKPDKYNVSIIFSDTIHNCGDDILQLTFDVNYQDAIIEQNWNDVIALLNDRYNGGYTFSSYQWYKDNQPLAGETRSYIYVPEGLDINAEYRLQLTRTDDNVTLFTCPLRPVLKNDINVLPTVTFPGKEVRVSAPSAGTVKIWDVTGVLVSVQSIVANGSAIVAPASSGMYILEIILDNGMTKTERIVITKE